MYIYCINDNGCPRPKAIGETVEKAIENWNLRSPVEAATPTAWRVYWVSLNTARTELFEDHAKATAKARETGGCVIPLFTGVAQPPEQPRWRHKKRGTTYTEVGRANLQIATDPIEEDDRVVIYRSDADGRLWVRGEAEFQDGRFEALPMSSTEGKSHD
jgi:hypothetical protein